MARSSSRHRCRKANRKNRKPTRKVSRVKGRSRRLNTRSRSHAQKALRLRSRRFNTRRRGNARKTSRVRSRRTNRKVIPGAGCRNSRSSPRAKKRHTRSRRRISRKRSVSFGKRARADGDEPPDLGEHLDEAPGKEAEACGDPESLGWRCVSGKYHPLDKQCRCLMQNNRTISDMIKENEKFEQEWVNDGEMEWKGSPLIGGKATAQLRQPTVKEIGDAAVAYRRMYPEWRRPDEDAAGRPPEKPRHPQKGGEEDEWSD